MKTPIQLHLDSSQVALARRFAKTQTIARTNIRTRQEHQAHMHEDALIGELGTIAVHQYMFGSVDKYKEHRLYQEHLARRNQLHGDGGFDIPGCNIDVKTTRRLKAAPDRFNLCVRPHELRDNWLYILALVDYPIIEETATAWIVGWAMRDMFPQQPESTGKLAGTYTIAARNLGQMMPYSWLW